MKIFITASKSAYPEVARIKAELEQRGHVITPPNGYEDPTAEQSMQSLSPEEYQRWKAAMLWRDVEIVKSHEAILVLNFEKNGQPNYIGGAVLLEMHAAFMLGKLIFLYNPPPDNMLRDEIIGMGPVVINGELNQIK